MLDVAMIGVGRWCRLIGSKLRNRNDINLVYFCDTDRNKRGCLEQEESIFTTNYRNVGNVDAVIITTYPNYHGEMSLYFSKRGCDVFVEKPAALSVGEIENLRKIARKQGRKIATGLQETYNNQHIEKILDGKEVVGITDQRNIRHPHLSKRLLGCTIDEDVPSIHFNEMANHLFGIKTESIEPRWLSEDSMSYDFLCENGVIGKVRSNWVKGKTDRYIKFETTEGEVFVELGTTLKVRDGGESYEIPVGDKVGMLINDFMDSIDKNKEPLTSLQKDIVFKTHVDTLRSAKRY